MKTRKQKRKRTRRETCLSGHLCVKENQIKKILSYQQKHLGSIKCYVLIVGLYNYEVFLFIQKNFLSYKQLMTIKIIPPKAPVISISILLCVYPGVYSQIKNFPYLIFQTNVQTDMSRLWCTNFRSSSQSILCCYFKFHNNNITTGSLKREQFH